jgi:hypothetical protein
VIKKYCAFKLFNLVTFFKLRRMYILTKIKSVCFVRRTSDEGTDEMAQCISSKEGTDEIEVSVFC